MKRRLPLFLAALSGLLSSACDPESGKPGSWSPHDPATYPGDLPILPVVEGDEWVYQVKLEIMEGVSSPGASSVETRYRRTRTYLGKVSAAEGLPATDCFEVEVPGSPKEREFVEIHDDRILMRGSLILRPETTRPMWLDSPVVLVMAGMKPGTAIPELRTPDGSLTRKTEVIAREDVTVPAGTYRCILLLMGGSDGDVELRRSIWFSPGNGIIREEKTRYRRDKLIFRESHELEELNRKSPRRN